MQSPLASEAVPSRSQALEGIAVRTLGRGPSRLGVAIRTLFYPLLALGRSIRIAGPGPDGAALQVLLVEEPPTGPSRERMLELVRAADRTILVCWSMSKEAALSCWRELADERVSLAAPDPWLADPRLPRARMALPPLPASPGLDHLVRKSLGVGWFAAPAGPGPALDGPPIVFGFAEGPASLDRFRRTFARERAGRDLQFVLVTDEPAENIGFAAVFREGDPAWLDLLARARAAIVATDRPGSLNAAVWALTAARSGVPLLCDDLAALGGELLSQPNGDWERGLALYLDDTWFRSVDAALARQKSLGFTVEGAAEVWDRALAPHAVPAEPPQAIRRPVLMVLLDLPQDLDVALPILIQLRERGDMELRVVVTDWLRREAPRTLMLLDEAGLPYEIVKRVAAMAGQAPDLDRIDGFLAPSATSEASHRTGFGLTQLAARAGAATFTCQHGFENVGLTYRPNGAHPVTFAADHIFAWGPLENLPAWLPTATRRKVVATGNPKLSGAPSGAGFPLSLLGEHASRSPLIGVFENLHWERFDEGYVQAFLETLAAVAERLPDALLLVKPHSAGRWMTRNSDRVPSAPNIMVVDPLSRGWARFTAPELIEQMDAVITTPSTVAVDAARAGKPCGVIGGPRLDLGAYAPLPVLTNADDWIELIRSAGNGLQQAAVRNELFLRANFLAGRGDIRCARRIAEILAARRPAASTSTGRTSPEPLS
jgi:hypothetical protein